MYFLGKSKSKTISKSKKRKKRKHSSKKKNRIPLPPNMRKLDDDTVVITNYSNSKDVSGQFRKSFHELSKEDLDREYSATIDYKPNTSNRIHQVDIQRGKTAKEGSKGRASVISRVDRNDEVTMHNHPKKDDISVKWERPSGGDISNIIWLVEDGYNLKASYVKSADGRFIRYRVWNHTKAIQATHQAKRDYRSLATVHDKEVYFGATDWEIEQQYQSIYQNEMLLGYKKTIMSQKNRIKQDRLEKQSIAELKEIEEDPNLTDKQKAVKIGERSTKWIKIMNQFDKVAHKKNPKYIPDDTPFRKRELMLKRRAFNEWSNYLYYTWGVEVKRMPKGFKYPISTGE